MNVNDVAGNYMDTVQASLDTGDYERAAMYTQMAIVEELSRIGDNLATLIDDFREMVQLHLTDKPVHIGAWEIADGTNDTT